MATGGRATYLHSRSSRCRSRAGTDAFACTLTPVGIRLVGEPAALEEPRDPAGGPRRHPGHLGVVRRRQREESSVVAVASDVHTVEDQGMEVDVEVGCAALRSTNRGTSRSHLRCRSRKVSSQEETTPCRTVSSGGRGSWPRIADTRRWNCQGRAARGRRIHAHGSGRCTARNVRCSSRVRMRTDGPTSSRSWPRSSRRRSTRRSGP